MLPIDEHAKSGAWVYAKWDDHPILPKMPVLTKWVHGPNGWLYPATASSIILIDPVGYLPASWVENAAKIRADLRQWSETFPEEKSTAEILAATTWPEVKL